MIKIREDLVRYTVACKKATGRWVRMQCNVFCKVISQHGCKKLNNQYVHAPRLCALPLLTVAVTYFTQHFLAPIMSRKKYANGAFACKKGHSLLTCIRNFFGTRAVSRSRKPQSSLFERHQLSSSGACCACLSQ